MRVRGWFAAVGAAALVTGVLATAAPAFGGPASNGGSKPWPILRVEKTIGEADDDFDDDAIVVPEDTEFVIRVTCESQHRNGGPGNMDANGLKGPFVSELTFDSEGDPEEADPADKWHTEDDAFVTSGWHLKHSLCTAEEIEPDDDGDGEDGLEVAYKCEAEASPVAYVGDVAEEAAEAAYLNGAPFGCVEPLPEGVYHPEAEQAQVQFTSPWDRRACGIENDIPFDAAAAPVAPLCQEIGTLTVDNFDPSWIPAEVVPETPVAIEIAPKFTG